MNTNAAKYIYAILIGASLGIVSAASDTQPQQLKDYIRHAAIGSLPALGALNMTLQKRIKDE